jgi:hypothetical protein
LKGNDKSRNNQKKKRDIDVEKKERQAEIGE